MRKKTFFPLIGWGLVFAGCAPQYIPNPYSTLQPSSTQTSTPIPVRTSTPAPASSTSPTSASTQIPVRTSTPAPASSASPTSASTQIAIEVPNWKWQLSIPKETGIDPKVGHYVGIEKYPLCGSSCDVTHLFWVRIGADGVKYLDDARGDSVQIKNGAFYHEWGEIGRSGTKNCPKDSYAMSGSFTTDTHFEVIYNTAYDCEIKKANIFYSADLKIIPTPTPAPTPTPTTTPQ